MTDIDQSVLYEIIKLSRFCLESESISFPGLQYPWSVVVDGNSYNAASDRAWILFIKSVANIGASGSVPSVDNFIRECKAITEWHDMKLSFPTCKYCSVDIATVDDVEDEICDLCTTEILERRVRMKRVEKITENYLVTKVAHFGKDAIAFKFEDGNGFAILMGCDF